MLAINASLGFHTIGLECAWQRGTRPVHVHTVNGTPKVTVVPVGRATSVTRHDVT